MQALFEHLKAAAIIDFGCRSREDTLTDVDRADLLFPGLPVFGPGMAEGVMIESVDVEARTVTLSEPVSEGGASLDFSTGFLTADTRVLHWQQVDAQPALFLRRTGVLDHIDPENFFPVTTLECEVWIYCNAGQAPDAKPDDTLTALEKLVRDSFPLTGIMAIRALPWAAWLTGAVFRGGPMSHRAIRGPRQSCASRSWSPFHDRLKGSLMSTADLSRMS
jgi:hypothetical protein